MPNESNGNPNNNSSSIPGSILITNTNTNPTTDAPTEWTPEEEKEIRATLCLALERTDKGAIASTIGNCRLIFQCDPLFTGRLSRNLLTETDNLAGPLPWHRTSTRFDDEDLPHILLHFERHYGIRSEKNIVNALRIVASEHSFHPIRDRLRGLRWDGEPRLRNALHHFLGADVNEYNEACLRVFLLGAVGRVFHPGCKAEMMLVLTGKQGCGKSTFLRFLAMEDDWFSDDLRKLDDEKIYQRLAGHWIMEMSEMVATANAKSIEEIKSFLSRSKDTYRFPYDRFTSDHPRQCVFAGSTNKTDFLPMDRTGNRRFLPVQVHPENAEVHILEDEAASRAYIEQLWAEVMVLYDSGLWGCHPDRELEQMMVREQKKFQQEDTPAGQIYDFMDTYHGERLCTKQIYKEALDHPFDEPKQWETREIFEIVSTGIENGDIQGWRPLDGCKRFGKYGVQRGWERIPPEERKNSAVTYADKSVEEMLQLGFSISENNPDFPF